MRILFFLGFLLFNSCAQEVLPVTLTAHISNIEANEIIISGNGYKKSLAVEDAKVSDTLQISKAGVYTLSFERRRSKIYLAPGDVVDINADAKNFKNTFNIESPNASIQDYLAQKEDLNRAFFSRNNYRLEPQEYLTKIKEGKDSLNALLVQLGVPESFATFEKENIEYNDANAKYIYPDYARKSLDSLSADFQDPLKRI